MQHQRFDLFEKDKYIHTVTNHRCMWDHSKILKTEVESEVRNQL